LAEAITRPTLGARRLLEHLEDRDIHRSASGVEKVLRRHNLGTRREHICQGIWWDWTPSTWAS